MRLAVISDIHSNAPALEAVLADIAARAVHQVINLGDTLYGPIDPLQTYQLLIASPQIRHILGNGDRELLLPADDTVSTMNDVRRMLGDQHRQWLLSMPPHASLDGLLFCHAAPTDDAVYLLEKVTAAGVTARPEQEIAALIGERAEKIILSGHSHIPQIKTTARHTIINVGSVGLPAYQDDLPYPHSMSSGDPCAKYVLLDTNAPRQSAALIKVTYDNQKAAHLAKINGRPDWQKWLTTGQA